MKNKKGFDYHRTYKGVTWRTYSSQKCSAKTRNHHPPTYTLHHLQDWCFSQPIFYKLYNNWVKSGYQRKMKPSVDRIDCLKSYTLDNIQLMTFHENMVKGRKEWRHTIGGHKKGVACENPKNNIIAIFISREEAARWLKTSHSAIKIAIKHKTRSKGYYWSNISFKELGVK